VTDELDQLDLERRESRERTAEAGAEQRTAVGRRREAFLQAGGEIAE
jgi:hypothetical protein